MHEQAAPAARSVAVDHVDFPQSEARAVGHFDGARHSLGVDGRPLGADALKRQHPVQHVVGDLLKAEIAEKHARSIKYQMTASKLPLARELDGFEFTGTPINEGLVRDLATGTFLASQRNVVLVGGRRCGKMPTRAGFHRDGAIPTCANVRRQRRCGDARPVLRVRGGPRRGALRGRLLDGERHARALLVRRHVRRERRRGDARPAVRLRRGLRRRALRGVRRGLRRRALRGRLLDGERHARALLDRRHVRRQRRRGKSRPAVRLRRRTQRRALRARLRRDGVPVQPPAWAAAAGRQLRVRRGLRRRRVGGAHGEVLQ